MSGAHPHRPDPDTQHVEPSSARTARGGPTGSAFTTHARCVSCGRRIIHVEPAENRQGYWRTAA